MWRRCPHTTSLLNCWVHAWHHPPPRFVQSPHWLQQGSLRASRPMSIQPGHVGGSPLGRGSAPFLASLRCHGSGCWKRAASSALSWPGGDEAACWAGGRGSAGRSDGPVGLPGLHPYWMIQSSFLFTYSMFVTMVCSMVIATGTAVSAVTGPAGGKNSGGLELFSGTLAFAFAFVAGACRSALLERRLVGDGLLPRPSAGMRTLPRSEWPPLRSVDRLDIACGGQLRGRPVLS